MLGIMWDASPASWVSPKSRFTGIWAMPELTGGQDNRVALGSTQSIVSGAGSCQAHNTLLSMRYAIENVAK